MTAEDVLAETRRHRRARPGPGRLRRALRYGGRPRAALARVAPGASRPRRCSTGRRVVDAPRRRHHRAGDRSGGGAAVEGFRYELAVGAGGRPTDADFGRSRPVAPARRSTGTLARSRSATSPPPCPAPRRHAVAGPERLRVHGCRVVVTDAQGKPGRGPTARTSPTATRRPARWPRFTKPPARAPLCSTDLAATPNLEVVEADTPGRVTVTQADGRRCRRSRRLSRGSLLRRTTPTSTALASRRAGDGAERRAAHAGGFDVDGDLAPEIVAAAVDGRLFVL